MSIFGAGRATVWRLSAAQALAGSHATVVFATGAVLGRQLAPEAALATLPISLFVVGMAASTLPAGRIATRHGRSRVFLIGNILGILAGLTAALGVWLQSFVLFCIATFAAGGYAAVVLTFRFAAAECVPAPAMARALSTVLAGGVLAGLIGGQLVSFTMNLIPGRDFLGTYLASSGIALLAAVLLSKVKLDQPIAAPTASGRAFREIARQPLFLAAVSSGLVTYLLMNFLMTSAPLAMRMHGLAQHHANTAVQWHVVAMYAPSFVVGRLITRFGAPLVTAAGLVIIGLSAAIGLMGMTSGHFLAAMIVLGIGWNFGFTGASAMVLETHRPEERARVQSANDFIVFGAVAVGSFLSGGVLVSQGWAMVCVIAFPPVLAALVALFAFAGAGRVRRSTPRPDAARSAT
jgi:MFS family permease